VLECTATLAQDGEQDALAAEQLSVGEEEIARLEEPYVPHPVLGHG
jgi:hypothetical protein